MTYGPEHRRVRATLIPQALNTVCPCCWGAQHTHRCDGLMINPARMDLDHSTALILGGTGAGDRIICQPCNRSAGARLGNYLRAHPISEEW